LIVFLPSLTKDKHFVLFLLSLFYFVSPARILLANSKERNLNNKKSQTQEETFGKMDTIMKRKEF